VLVLILGRNDTALSFSAMTLMDLTLPALDHTTMSRRAAGLAVIEPDSAPYGPLHLLGREAHPCENVR
jgi:hypothetical protein